MKKLISFFLAIIITIAFSITLQAQESTKGKFIIGGDCNLNFSSLKSTTEFDYDENVKTKQVKLAPSVGYFLNENLLIGVSIPISFEWQKNYFHDKESANSLALAPKVRHYFSSGHVKPFLEASIGLGKSIYHSENRHSFWYYGYHYIYDETIKMNSFLYDLECGVGVFLNKNVALDFSLGYGYISTKPTKDYDSRFNTDSKYITKGLQANIGFSIIL